jgi:hypothetical protein
MNNQLLRGLQTTWISHVIVESNIADKVNEDNIGYSFLSNTYKKFHHHHYMELKCIDNVGTNS